MTPNDLITLALKQAGIVGVGQTPLAEDTNDAFSLLNMMLGQWNRRRWLIFHEIDVPFMATGAQVYTVGIGGDVNTPRPDRLEGAYFRYVTGQAQGGTGAPSESDFSSDFNTDFGGITPTAGVDYPLQLLQSLEDYSRIAFKSLGTFPQAVYYEPSYPFGRLSVWPVPRAPYEIHLLVKDQLVQLPNQVETINLPNEYLEAILYNLAVRLWDHYQMPPRPQTASLARAALNTIRNANTQVPTLQPPAILDRPGVYNVISDTYT